MKIEEVDIDILIPDPDNARKHGEKNMQAIRGSIKKFDMVEPLIVRRQNNVVIGGNGRLQALKDLGYKTVPVNYVDYDDQKSKALALTLNRTSELAEWNDDILGVQLQSLFEDGFDIAEIGFDLEFNGTPFIEETSTDVTNGPSVEEKLEKYLKREFLEIKLNFDREKYDAIIEKLDTNMKNLGLESYSDVVSELLGVN